MGIIYNLKNTFNGKDRRKCRKLNEIVSYSIIDTTINIHVAQDGLLEDITKKGPKLANDTLKEYLLDALRNLQVIVSDNERIEMIYTSSPLLSYRFIAKTFEELGFDVIEYENEDIIKKAKNKDSKNRKNELVEAVVQRDKFLTSDYVNKELENVPSKLENPIEIKYEIMEEEAIEDNVDDVCYNAIIDKNGIPELGEINE